MYKPFLQIFIFVGIRYVCVYLESLIGTRYLIRECGGVVSKTPKNTAKAMWAQKC